MKKKKFLIMLLMAGALLWAAGRVLAQSEEAAKPQQGHDSTAVMEHRKKEIELSRQRKEAAKRFREMRAKAAHDSASCTIPSDTTFNENIEEGGPANE